MFIFNLFYSEIKEEFQKNFMDLMSNHLSALSKGRKSCADLCALELENLLAFDPSHSCSSYSVVQGERHSRERDHSQYSPEDVRPGPQVL